MPGHAGGPPLDAVDHDAISDAIERALDELGWETAHPATRWAAARCSLPPALVVDIIRATAGCDGAPAMIDYVLREPWTLETERIDCPVCGSSGHRGPAAAMAGGHLPATAVTGCRMPTGSSSTPPATARRSRISSRPRS
jgi:hypothetical protein